MANNDLKISEMPLVDGVVEGDVVPAVHNGENVAVNGKFFDDLANGIVDLGDDMNATNASVASLQGEVAAKQDALTTSADLSISDNNELSLTDMAKKRLFIDMWNAACGTYGRYNTKTGFFELNGLTDITYQEALLIDAYGIPSGDLDNKYSGQQGVRTYYPYKVANVPINADCAFNYNNSLVVFNGVTIKTTKMAGMFQGCINLRSVQIIDVVNSSPSNTAFMNCYKLETLKINRLGGDMNVQWSPLLTLSSFQSIVQNATNKSPITITVHPDVYAKLTGDTTNAAAAALTPEELAQWQQVVTDAAEKDISFIEATA